MFLFEKLPIFFADLRGCGFTIGISEQQRVNQLLLHLSALDSFPEKAEILCSMIAPIVCTSDKQQRLFRNRFEAHFGDGKVRYPFKLNSATHQSYKNVYEDILSNQEHKPNSNVSPQYKREIIRAQLRMIFAGVAIIFMFVVSANLLFQTGLISIEFKTIEIEPPKWTLKGSVPNTTAKVAPRNSNILDRIFDSSSQILNVTSGAWGNALSKFGMLPLFLATIPFSVIALWAAAGKKRNAFLNRRSVEGQPELLELMVSAPNLNPFLFDKVFRQTQVLRRPRMIQSRDIDVDASLNSTLENLGVFTPVYARHPIAPEYLILIERHGNDDHVTCYAESLISVLRQAQVFVDTFYFTGDFRLVFKTPDSQRITFEEMTGRYPEHRLILVTSGSGMFNLATGRIETWATQLLRFSRRVLLTPAPTELWSYRESELSKALDIAILPLLPNSLALMAEVLSADEPLKPLSPEKQQNSSTGNIEKLADLLDSRPNLWLASSKPSETIRAALKSALFDALGSSGFHWFKSCAVYPELNWNLTLFIGSKLRGIDGKPLFSPKLLLLLSALPWFRDGGIPTWLRKSLTESMSQGEYRNTHWVLSRLLLSIFNYGQNTFKLNVSLDSSSSAQKIEERIQRQLTDPVLIDFLSTRWQKERSLFNLPAEISKSLGLSQSKEIQSNIFSQNEEKETKANSEALKGTLKIANITSIKVSRAKMEDSNENPEFRAVVRFETSDGKIIEMQDEYWLYLPIGKFTALLIDSVTANILNFRSRLAIKLSLINIILVILFSMFVYAPTLRAYSEIVAIGFLSLCIIMPFVILHLLLVKRFTSFIKSFPVFMPQKGILRHKANQFEYLKDN